MLLLSCGVGATVECKIHSENDLAAEHNYFIFTMVNAKGARSQILHNSCHREESPQLVDNGADQCFLLLLNDTVY